MYMYVYIYICVCIYIYIYTYTHIQHDPVRHDDLPCTEWGARERERGQGAVNRLWCRSRGEPDKNLAQVRWSFANSHSGKSWIKQWRCGSLPCTGVVPVKIRLSFRGGMHHHMRCLWGGAPPPFCHIYFSFRFLSFAHLCHVHHGRPMVRILFSLRPDAPVYTNMP